VTSHVKQPTELAYTYTHA